MAKSRYAQTPTQFDPDRDEPRHYKNWDLPEGFKGYNVPSLRIFDDQQYIKYKWNFGDRLDRLAEQQYGDGSYWWVIAFVNNIPYPLGIVPGTIIYIPLSVRPILEKLGLV